jgi:hypothetical protein
MLNLAIQHVIHLTRSQRYALHDGIHLVVTGMSVPVWYMDKATSEPAREVFCKYYLKNTKEDVPIEAKDDGYELTLPFREGKGLEISNEEWRELNLTNPEKLEHMYDQCVQEVSSKNLLDIPDGCAHLTYREHSEVLHDDKKLHIIHFVQICDVGDLLESLD